MENKHSYFSSSPGLMAITFPSTTAVAPLVAAATKSLVIWNKDAHWKETFEAACPLQRHCQDKHLCWVQTSFRPLAGLVKVGPEYIDLIQLPIIIYSFISLLSFSLAYVKSLTFWYLQCNPEEQWSCSLAESGLNERFSRVLSKTYLKNCSVS